METLGPSAVAAIQGVNRGLDLPDCAPLCSAMQEPGNWCRVRYTWVERISIEELPPLDWPVAILIVEWCGRT